ncbi:MAG: 16S rRNA (guanine(966)-N(2))-methyltransferase RsmD [Acidiferrobacteraceae bacterium]
MWSAAEKSKPRRRAPPGTVRIIGGRWRSRRLVFPQAQALRPSPDRVRVTLFNWLTPVISGARCLDLFAGSGCLGLEALSRGASEAVFVECDHRTAANLEHNIAMLDAAGARVVEADALSFLQRPEHPFDIVFVDPPFSSGLLEPVLAALAGGWLKATALVYVESALTPEALITPGFDTIKDKSAGAVRYRLLAGRKP